MITSQIVEEIVTEVLRRMELLYLIEKPHLLVINQSSEQNKTQIKELKRDWHVVEMNQHSSEIPPGVQRAVFLEVNQDLLVKGALGITDTPESLLFSKLMYLDYQVDFVPNNSLSWSLNLDEKKQVNRKYISQLFHYQAQLREFGVRLCPLKFILPVEENGISISSQIKASSDYSEKLLTKDQVEKWENDSICIHPNTIITPLAQDVARERGITIYTNESKRGNDKC